MKEGKKGKYNFIFIVVILVIIVLTALILYLFPAPAAKVILTLNINESLNVTNNSVYYPYQGIKVVSDFLFGKAYNFTGQDYLKTKDYINSTNGFSVVAFAVAEDNTNRNNLGIVSTSYQSKDRGFRLKYRNFEEADRVYVIVGNETLYGSIPREACYMVWCQYAFTYNPNGRVNIYVNGEKIRTDKTDSEIILDNKINIGNTIDINQEYFRGRIANVSVYSGVLSDNQIADMAKVLKQPRS